MSACANPAATMFASFILFGSMPLIGYCVFPPLFPSLTIEELFVVASIVTGFALFVLGAVKVRTSRTLRAHVLFSLTCC